MRQEDAGTPVIKLRRLQYSAQSLWLACLAIVHTNNLQSVNINLLIVQHLDPCSPNCIEKLVADGKFLVITGDEIRAAWHGQFAPRRNKPVFRLNTDGSGLTNLHDFGKPPIGEFGQNSDGVAPKAGLIVSGNTLFGTTWSGGMLGGGTLFKLNTDGSGFEVVRAFDRMGYALNPPFAYINSGGAYPSGLLLSGDTVYCSMSAGGEWGVGTIFKSKTDGTGYHLLYVFTLTGGQPFTYSNIDGEQPNDLILSGNTLYGTTFSGGISGNGNELILKIIPGPKGHISIEKVQNLFIKLREWGFHFDRITYDMFQSTLSLQMLEARGFNVDRLSIDREKTPYTALRIAAQDHRLRLYRHPTLRRELTMLVDCGKKFNHPPGSGTKDVADAVAGAFLNATEGKDKNYLGIENLPVMGGIGVVPMTIEMLQEFNFFEDYMQKHPRPIRNFKL